MKLALRLSGFQLNFATLPKLCLKFIHMHRRPTKYTHCPPEFHSEALKKIFQETFAKFQARSFLSFLSNVMGRRRHTRSCDTQNNCSVAKQTKSTRKKDPRFIPRRSRGKRKLTEDSARTQTAKRTGRITPAEAGLATAGIPAEPRDAAVWQNMERRTAYIFTIRDIRIN